MNRAVFVTGGSRGLGLEIARAHRRRGDRVALLARGRAALDAAVDALGDPPAATFVADVRDVDAVRAALRAFAGSAGPIGRLYANAGKIDAPGGDRGFDREAFDTNLYGVVHAVEGWLATSPPTGSAVGVISSFSAFRGLPHLPAYGASKAAVTIYAESLRGRLRPAGITVTTAFLGYLDSELASGAKPGFLTTPCARAAEIVTGAVERGRTRVAYPPLVRAMVFATRLLPDAIYDRLVAGRYRKASS